MSTWDALAGYISQAGPTRFSSQWQFLLIYPTTTCRQTAASVLTHSHHQYSCNCSSQSQHSDAAVNHMVSVLHCPFEVKWRKKNRLFTVIGLLCVKTLIYQLKYLMQVSRTIDNECEFCPLFCTALILWTNSGINMNLVSRDEAVTSFGK